MTTGKDVVGQYPPLVPTADPATTQPCLRANECSQQQLVRLVGYRGPLARSGQPINELPRAILDRLVIT